MEGEQEVGGFSDYFICDVLRTPFGRFDGACRHMQRVDHAAAVKNAVAERQELDAAPLPFGEVDRLFGVQPIMGMELITGISVESEYNHDQLTEAAVAIGRKWKIPSEMIDIYTMESHEKARLAANDGFLKAEILPIPVTGVGEDRWWDRDECLASNPRPDHVAQSVFGVASILVCSGKEASVSGIKPLARVTACASAMDSGNLMGIGMIEAAESLVRQSGMKFSDVGLWAILELSAEHALAFACELDLVFDRNNVWGGAIAYGIPGRAGMLHIIGALARQMHHYGVEIGVAAGLDSDGQARAVLLNRAH